MEGRKLDPSLFSAETGSPHIGSPVPAAGHSAPLNEARPSWAQPIIEQRTKTDAPDPKSVENLWQQMRTHIHQLEKRVASLQSRMDQMLKSSSTKIERLAHSQQKIEESMARFQEEQNGKIAAVLAKLNERKVGDGKLQEMLDRHNLIVRNFENRLTVSQRMMNEHESALHSAHAALDDARSEIARLKRG